MKNIIDNHIKLYTILCRIVDCITWDAKKVRRLQILESGRPKPEVIRFLDSVKNVIDNHIKLNTILCRIVGWILWDAKNSSPGVNSRANVG